MPRTPNHTAKACFATPPAVPNSTKEAIVDGVAWAFNLQADDIRLDGFVVQGSVFGVQTSSAFSGYRIRDNLAQGNAAAGVNFLSNGTKESRADHNCFRLNGEGLESEVGPLLSNARVDHNAATRNAVGIDASGVGARTKIIFDHNKSITETAVGYLISNSTNSEIVHNFSQNDPNGISMGGANTGLEVSHNDVLTGTGSGIVASLAASFPIFPTPSANVEISHNHVEHRGISGIRALPASLVNSTISHNDTFENTVDGIRLESGDTGNHVDKNSADRNHQHGIYALAGAISNFFIGNHMFDNTLFDARDDTRPLNQWHDNHCKTDFPPGTICGVK
jgi:nitrous oxidase accessory protein NosD